MTKLTLELEGEAYADGLATADKFLALMTERLDRIDKNRQHPRPHQHECRCAR